MLLVLVVLVSFGVTWPIQVSKINTQMNIPRALASNPTFTVLAQSLTNTTGDVQLTLQDFNFTSSELSTRLSGSSAVIDVTITPEGENARINLNVQLNGVKASSPSFSGRLSSVKMNGYVVVDPKTNKMVISIVTSTSVLDIIRGVLGI